MLIFQRIISQFPKMKFFIKFIADSAALMIFMKTLGQSKPNYSAPLKELFELFKKKKACFKSKEEG